MSFRPPSRAALRALFAVALGLGLFCVVGTHSTPAQDSISLEIQRSVAAAIARGAPPSTAIGNLPPVPRAYGQAIFDRAAGRDAAARQRLSRQLGAALDGPMRAGILDALIEVGIDAASRSYLQLSTEPLDELAFAAVLAGEGRCERALGIYERHARSSLDTTDAILLAGRTLDSCDRPELGLAMLRGKRRDDPRLLFLVGTLQARLGDDAAAARWCRRADELAEGLPITRWQARSCAAAARMRLGLLPAARDEYLNALRRMVGEGVLPLTDRVRIATQAAWVALGSDRAASVPLLLDALPRLRGEDATRVSVLRAMSLVDTEQVPQALRALPAVSARATPELQALHALAESRIAIAGQDFVAASAALTRAMAAAQQARLDALEAAVEAERARVAQLEGRDLIAEQHAMLALSAWARARKTVSKYDLHDPSLARSVVDLVLNRDLGDVEQLREQRAERMLRVADNMRSAMQGEPLADPPVDLYRLRRHLATGDAGLLYFALGAQRTYVWFVESGETIIERLPPGSKLHERVSEWMADARLPPPAVEELSGTLLAVHGTGTGLMVSPEGFLGGVAWNHLRAPATASPSQQRLEAVYRLSVMPSLKKVTEPLGARLDSIHDYVSVIAVMPQGTQSSSWFELDAFDRFDHKEAIDADSLTARTLIAYTRQGPSILHLDLPALGARMLEVGGEPFSPTEMFDSSVAADLVVLDSSRGWAAEGGSLAATCEHVAKLGARACLAVLEPQTSEAHVYFFERFYEYLASGSTKAEALRQANNDLIVNLNAPPARAVLYGHADTRVTRPARSWLPMLFFLGALAALLAGVAALLMRKQPDPFDIPPPEEAPAGGGLVPEVQSEAEG